MTDQADQTSQAPVPFMLTIMVDMKHEFFADRGFRARVALAQVLQGLADAALRGCDATLAQDTKGKTVAVYMIAPDETGEGRQAFDTAELAISGEAFREVSQHAVGIGG